MLSGGENGLAWANEKPRGVIGGDSTKETALDVPRECEDGGRRSGSPSNDASGASFWSGTWTGAI